MRPALGGVLALSLAACAAPMARTGPPWPARSEDFAALAAQFPHSATLQRRLLAAAHERRDAAAVRAGLTRLAVLGYAPAPQTIDLLGAYFSEAEMAALRLHFDSNRASVAASRVLATVPAEYRLVEGVAWDESRSRLFAATVVSRALVIREPLGWVKVEGLDAGSLFGLAIDRRREMLWVASGRLEQTPSPDTAFRGLIGIDLNSMMTARRLPAPGEGSPADITVGPDGSVYASDPMAGAVYRARPGDTALSVLVAPGRIRNPQGLVVSADGGRLYVSDYVQGLAIVDLASGAVTRLESDGGTMLDGIDGLTAWPGGLIAIQNGTSPRRILFLRLSRDGGRIAGVRVLESANPDWGEPTLGFVRGDEFVYVADAQWERYGAGGALQGEGPPRATAIRALRPPR